MSVSLSANGQRTAVVDGVNNRTTLAYDGFDRLVTQYFPSKTRGANAHNPADYEAYGYDLVTRLDDYEASIA